MKQRSLFILLLIFLFHHSISEFECTNMADRMPAGLSCQKIFTDHFLIENKLNHTEIRIPKIAELTHFFDQLENYGEGGKRSSYEKSISFKYQIEVGHPAIQLGKELFQRDLLGDENVQILKSLGYRTINNMIVPPQKMETLYLKLYQHIFESARKFQIPQSGLILPAIVFQYKNDSQKLLFIRPGIDPLPDQNLWTVPVELKDFERHLFAEMILHRKFIIEPLMLPHDIGHLVDFIKHPIYHQVYYEYIQSRTSYDQNLKKQVHRYVFNAFEKYLDQIVNEWIYLPNQKNIKLINKLIPHFQFKKLLSKEQIADKYRRMPREKIKVLAKELLKNQYLIFSSHGGGTHDTSYVKFRNHAIGYDAFMDRIFGSANDVYWLKHRPDLPPSTFEETESIDRFLKYQAPAIFERLNLLLETQASNYINGILHRAAESKNKENDLEFAKYELIVAHLTEIEQRLQDGLFYQLTPEQIVRDFQTIYQINGLKKFKETKTALYFSNFPRGSAPRFLFFDLMDLDSHSK